MSKIIDDAKTLKKELDNTPLIQEYMQIRDIFQKNEEILQLKKEIVRAKNENRIEDHKRLKKEYDNHPLVMNYLSLQEEVRALLKQICDIINI